MWLLCRGHLGKGSSFPSLADFLGSKSPRILVMGIPLQAPRILLNKNSQLIFRGCFLNLKPGILNCWKAQYYGVRIVPKEPTPPSSAFLSSTHITRFGTHVFACTQQLICIYLRDLVSQTVRGCLLPYRLLNWFEFLLKSCVFICDKNKIVKILLTARYSGVHT